MTENVVPISPTVEENLHLKAELSAAHRRNAEDHAVMAACVGALKYERDHCHVCGGGGIRISSGSACWACKRIRDAIANLPARVSQLLAVYERA